MDFIILASLAGFGVALAAAPLGAFIVWQRLAYFGDTLAHSALLGVAFSLILSVNTQVGIIVTCVLVAIALLFWQNQRDLPSDTLLGIISHSSLALGLIMVTRFGNGRLDLSRYLLGDILATNVNDLILIYAISIVIGVLIWRNWRALLAITVNEELAKVEGISVFRVQLLLMVLLAMSIALAINIVGVLLIAALLIIPPASARYLSSTPEQMVFIAAFIGCISVLGGLGASWLWDTPAGPSIVATASCSFAVIFFTTRLAFR